jgi:hypothetical protein
MSFRNQVGILSFDEIFFPKEFNVGTLVIHIIRFTFIIIIGFDPNVVEVQDLAIGITQSKFFMKVGLWIKTRPGTDGRQWSFIQTQQTKLLHYPWPFWTTLNNKVIRELNSYVPILGDIWVIVEVKL